MAVIVLNQQRTFQVEVEKLQRRLNSITKDLQCFGDVHFVLTRNSKIQQLNQTYRGKNKPTDVLSFPAETQDWPCLPGQDGIGIVGDVVISLDAASQQATLHRHSLQQELLVLAIHGLLHLLGYDHIHGGRQAGKMRRLESQLLQRYGFVRKRVGRSKDRGLLARNSCKPCVLFKD